MYFVCAYVCVHVCVTYQVLHGALLQLYVHVLLMLLKQ